MNTPLIPKPLPAPGLDPFLMVAPGGTMIYGLGLAFALAPNGLAYVKLGNADLRWVQMPKGTP